VALVSLLVVFHGCNLACSADWLFGNKVKALMKAKSMMEGSKKDSLIHRQAIAKLDKCRESAASGGSSKEEAIVRKESIRSQ